MKCALYHRASTLDQDPSLAREELRRAAAMRDLEVVLEVEETGSGARNDRPGLQRIMEAATRGKVQAILVWKLDRFGRSSLDLLSNINKLQRAGVRFIATSQGLDISPAGDPMGQLMLTVLAGVAEFERSIIIERTKLGMAKARKEGKQIGRPFSPSAPSLAQVVKLRSNGVSWRELAKELQCDPSTARRVLRVKKGNPTSLL